jgi:hypothetical protein
VKFEIGKSYIYNNKNDYCNQLQGTKMLITDLSPVPEALIDNKVGLTCRAIDKNGESHALYLDELDHINRNDYVSYRAKNLPNLTPLFCKGLYK